MDALQLLGSLLGNNATSSGQGEQILGQLIGGLMGGNTQSGRAGGGLADVLGGLMGGGAPSGGRPASPDRSPRAGSALLGTAALHPVKLVPSANGCGVV